MDGEWELEGMQLDEQSITREWQFTGRRLIEGVTLKEVRQVYTGYGVLVELWRADWALDADGVDQVFQSTLDPGGHSAWHAHAHTTDRLFANRGRVRVVLYDSRRRSPTHGVLNQFVLGTERAGLIVIPPRIWHGVFNETTEPASIVNLVDHAYRYEGPDHWRLPYGDPQIPYFRRP